MINGLGVVGWGVGGIEAEAVMLGQPCYMLIPEVVGVRLHGRLPEGANRDGPRAARDRSASGPRRGRQVRRVLRAGSRGDAARQPRDHRQHGTGVRRDGRASSRSTSTPSATSSSPAASSDLCKAVEQYARLQGLWRNDATEAVYTDVLEIDLSRIRALASRAATPAGPRRRLTTCDRSGTAASRTTSASLTRSRPSGSIAGPARAGRTTSMCPRSRPPCGHRSGSSAMASGSRCATAMSSSPRSRAAPTRAIQA